jgi:predicted small lipoprotein YifL
VRSVAASMLLVVVLSAGSLIGCGSDEGKRGLTPPASDEVAAPHSVKEDELTEAQRRKQNEQQEQGKEIQEFDAAEGAKP